VIPDTLIVFVIYLLEKLRMKFVYQGHLVKVKVKVTGAKTVSVCPVCGWFVFD